MISQPVYYKESGSVNYGSLALAFIALVIMALILGYAYAVLTQINPFIYLNALAVIGIGIAIMFIVNFTFDFFKIRNRMLRIGFAFLAGLMVWYCQWNATLLYLMYDTVPDVMLYLTEMDYAFRDSFQMELLPILYETGYYELKGTVISGTILLIVWIIELLLFIGFPVFVAWAHEAAPYSEEYEDWYEPHVLKSQFRNVTGGKTFIHDLHTNASETINNLSAGRGDAYSVITIYYLSKARTQYLHISNVTYEGKEKKEKVKTIVNSLAISKEQAQSILDHNDHVKG